MLASRSCFVGCCVRAPLQVRGVKLAQSLNSFWICPLSFSSLSHSSEKSPPLSVKIPSDGSEVDQDFTPTAPKETAKCDDSWMADGQDSVDQISTKERASSGKKRISPQQDQPQNAYKSVGETTHLTASSFEQSHSHTAYWKARVAECLRPVARNAASKLKWEYVMGVDPSTVGIGALFKDVILQARSKHPRKVILVKNGDFYETYGVDAVMLIQHCGLNPMGSGVPLPRAGFPLSNLRQTLADLVVAGLSACVIEERKTTNKGPKERFEAGVVTPASPVYLPGLVDVEGESFADVPPSLVLSLSALSTGFSVAECDVLAGRCYVMVDLTEEAVAARLAVRNFCQVHVHSSVSQFGGRILSAALLSFDCTRHSAESPHEYVCAQLSVDLKDHKWDTVFSHTSSRPRPLYLSTATQIGLLPYPGMPPILNYCLDESASLLVKQYTQRLLLSPPSLPVAQALRKTCILLARIKDPSPALRTISPAKLVRLICSEAANHSFFLDLLELTEGAVKTLTGCWQDVAEVLGPAVSEESNRKTFNSSLIITDCKTVSRAVNAVIETNDQTPHSGVRWQDKSGRQCGVPDSFWITNERGRGRVRRDWEGAVEFYAKLDVCASALIDAILEDFGIHIAEKRAELVHDVKNNALWLKARSLKVVADLIQPVDRKGEGVSNRFSTKKVEQCLKAYRDMCLEVGEMERRELKALSVCVQPYLESLSHANTLMLIMLTMMSHVTEALRRGWTVPDLNPESDTLHLEQVFPYWLPKNGVGTVPNDLKLSEMALLTGPNMAGKSTLSRTVCATALLANCGLMVPAQYACVPRFTNIILRNSSMDSPLERVSSFAVEMLQTRTVLRDSGKNSLVLMDELGKGTEPRAGTAIAGAVLEKLVSNGVVGLFATHHHDLLDLPLKKCQQLRMEIVPNAQGRLVPSWKVQHGVCRKSLALNVAEDMQLPEDVLCRARELFETQPSVGSSAPQLQTSNSQAKPLNNKVVTLEEGARLLARLSEQIPIILRGNEKLPPWAASQSCVYLRRARGGWWYVGESDAIHSRISAHRSSYVEVEFVVLPVSNKSRARELEADFIRVLKAEGFRLTSTSDSKHSHFGKS